MHCHLEIIMPPTDDVESAVAQILEPFREGGKDEDGCDNSHPFWDFYVIGGRWSGQKIKEMSDPETLTDFFAELANREVTVSGLQSGKPRLEPSGQISMVDALWCEYFPDSPAKSCPLFSHYNDQYKHTNGYPDVMRLGDVPRSLKAERVIIAGPIRDDDGSRKAWYMIQESAWNGVTLVDSRWDGLVFSALELAAEKIKGGTDGYVAKHTPYADWLVVTVDYHS